MAPSARLTWVRMYEQTRDAGLTCRRCGVSRPTLRKWWRRHEAEGIAGLTDRSRHPHHSLSRRVFASEEEFIVSLRNSRKLGIKRLRNELRRLHDIQLSVDTIHKVLCRHGLNRVKRPKLVRKRWKRWSLRLSGHLQTVRRRCSDVENTFALRAGVPAPDGRVGPLGAHARRAGSRVRMLRFGDSQLGASGRSRRGPS